MAISDKLLSFNVSNNVNSALIVSQDNPSRLRETVMVQGDKSTVRLRFFEIVDGAVTPIALDEDVVEICARWKDTNAQLFAPTEVEWEVYNVGLNPTTGSLFGGYTFETPVGKNFVAGQTYHVTQDGVDGGALFKATEVDANGAVKSGVLINGGFNYNDTSKIRIENPLGNPDLTANITSSAEVTTNLPAVINPTIDAVFEINLNIPFSPSGILFRAGPVDGTSLELSMKEDSDYPRENQLETQGRRDLSQFVIERRQVAGQPGTYFYIPDNWFTNNEQVGDIILGSPDKYKMETTAAGHSIWLQLPDVLTENRYLFRLGEFQANVPDSNEQGYIQVQLSNDNSNWTFSTSIPAHENIEPDRDAIIELNIDFDDVLDAYQYIKLTYFPGNDLQDEWVAFSEMELWTPGKPNLMSSDIENVANFNLEKLAYSVRSARNNTLDGARYKLHLGVPPKQRFAVGTGIKIIGLNNQPTATITAVPADYNGNYTIEDDATGNTSQLAAKEIGQDWVVNEKCSESFSQAEIKLKVRPEEAISYSNNSHHNYKIGIYNDAMSAIFHASFEMPAYGDYEMHELQNTFPDERNFTIRAYKVAEYFEICINFDVLDDLLGTEYNLLMGVQGSGQYLQFYDLTARYEKINELPVQDDFPFDSPHSFSSGAPNSDFLSSIYTHVKLAPAFFILKQGIISQTDLLDKNTIEFDWDNTTNAIVELYVGNDTSYNYDKNVLVPGNTYELSVINTNSNSKGCYITLSQRANWEDGTLNTYSYTLTNKNTVQFETNSTGQALHIELDWTAGSGTTLGGSAYTNADNFGITSISIKEVHANGSSFIKKGETGFYGNYVPHNQTVTTNFSNMYGSDGYYFYDGSFGYGNGAILPIEATANTNNFELKAGTECELTFNDIGVFSASQWGTPTSYFKVAGYREDSAWTMLSEYLDAYGILNNSMKVTTSSQISFKFIPDKDYEKFAIVVPDDNMIFLESIRLREVISEFYVEFAQGQLIVHLGTNSPSHQARVTVPVTNPNLVGDANLVIKIQVSGVDAPKLLVYANNNFLGEATIPSLSLINKPWISGMDLNLLTPYPDSNANSTTAFNGSLNSSLKYYQNPPQLNFLDDDINDLQVLPQEQVPLPNYSAPIDLDGSEVHALFNLGFTEGDAVFDIQAKKSDNSKIRTLAQFNAKVLRDVNFNGSSGTPYTP